MSKRATFFEKVKQAVGPRPLTRVTFMASELCPNPFRDLDRYPVNQQKLEMLRHSLRETGYWGNLLCRVKDGRPELAYGHHRLIAIREELGPDFEVDLSCGDFSDELMLRIMALENMDEWRHVALVEHETVRAVVSAYSDDRIELPVPREGAREERLRYAPSFVLGGSTAGDRSKPYTARAVHAFLRRPDKDRRIVLYALGALECIERGLLSTADLEGLTAEQSRHVLLAMRRAQEVVGASSEDSILLASDAGRAAALGLRLGVSARRIVTEVVRLVASNPGQAAEVMVPQTATGSVHEQHRSIRRGIYGGIVCMAITITHSNTTHCGAMNGSRRLHQLRVGPQGSQALRPNSLVDWPSEDHP